MADDPGKQRVVVATPLSDELSMYLVGALPEFDVVHRPDLLPPQRHGGDHAGDPAWSRTADQEMAFEQLLDSATALFGVPGEKPAQLRRTVRSNPGLRWVHTMPAGGGSQVRAAGLTREELDRVAFSTSAGVHAEPLAEFALLGALAAAKTLPRLQEQQRQHDWAPRWTMALLAQQTVVVVGLGHIGRTTAAKFSALGCTVIGVHRRQVEAAVDRIVPVDALRDIVATADVLVMTLPGTDSTEGLLDRSVLEAARPGLCVINIGRGSTVDEDALVEALRSGRVGSAALDVFAREPLPADSPLWDMPQVLISPHTASLHPQQDRLITELFVRNARRFLAGDELLNRVNTVEFY
ncbi:D-2-hydroxyacid dehydrogenase [Nakamurella sp. YIM 132087]|uniref:D-2-hydroxyacid dehydrogenase n=1 Tax=Nakamurella alba TaxID=2665158 RepID=A0A7K1FM73_9ACTN|nr:D-2-hydroxyacid dehydrogenase [Nakamurella alba]MTD15206.1 D-2-hydroxyacid dehydrogenase [Nakamurella alba]